MAKYKLEYIWLDGYEPVPNLRSKTLIKDFAKFPTLKELPIWGFDGSSTRQAEGRSSDCKLHPVAVFPDTARKNGVLVMCEVMMPDDKTWWRNFNGEGGPLTLDLENGETTGHATSHRDDKGRVTVRVQL